MSADLGAFSQSPPTAVWSLRTPPCAGRRGSTRRWLGDQAASVRPSADQCRSAPHTRGQCAIWGTIGKRFLERGEHPTGFEAVQKAVCVAKAALYPRVRWGRG